MIAAMTQRIMERTMTTPKTIKLNACPCCGKAPKIRTLDEITKRRNWIVCTGCGLSTQIYSRVEDAARRWNTRVTSDGVTVFVCVDGAYIERVKEQ